MVSVACKIGSDIYLQMQVPFVHYTTVTVSRGDSIWSLVKEEGFTATETQILIEHVLDINDLDDTGIRIGDTLRIPTRR